MYRPSSEHSLTPEAPSSQLHAIPSGVAGTLATLKIMWLLVKQGKISVPVRLKAVSLTNHLLQKDYRAEIEAIHRFVRDEIRYVRDINGVETLHGAEWLLRQGAGDCDDKSVLMAAMLESIGFRTRLVAIGFHPGRYCHVFIEVKLGKNWAPLEATEPVEAGWKFPLNPPLRMIYPPMPT